MLPCDGPTSGVRIAEASSGRLQMVSGRFFILSKKTLAYLK